MVSSNALGSLCFQDLFVCVCVCIHMSACTHEHYWLLGPEESVELELMVEGL